MTNGDRSLPSSGDTPNITWNGQIVKNNSLVFLSVVVQRVSAPNGTLYLLVCQGMTGGQWYQPHGVPFPQAMPGTVNATLPHGGLGQQNVSGGVVPTWCSMLYLYHSHTTLCWYVQ